MLACVIPCEDCSTEAFAKPLGQGFLGSVPLALRVYHCLKYVASPNFVACFYFAHRYVGSLLHR
jgi:hypothetical protein